MRALLKMRWLASMALSVALVGCLLPGARAAELELRMVKHADGTPVAFEVAGLTKQEAAQLGKLDAADAAWARILAVYVAGEAARGDVPPMLGSYTLAESTIRFTPKYPLKPGLRYRVVLQPAAVGNPQATDLPSERAVTVYVTAPAARPGEPTKVAAVYPSAATLPENQLRFYLHFSAPMSRGEVYSHVRLLDERGKPLLHPFLEIGEELWDKSGTRLTLLIDPGRIKRGLRPREEEGTVFQAGKKYSLVIDKGWHDAAGQILATRFEKRFAVGPPIETALEPATWKIEPPAAGSKEPLTLRFAAPLDHALLERTIDVRDADGKPVAGRLTIADEEKTWRFVPDTLWTAGKHELVIDTTLEDLVGNRIGIAFEVDQTGRIEKEVKTEFFHLPFTIVAAGAAKETGSRGAGRR